MPRCTVEEGTPSRLAELHAGLLEQQPELSLLAENDRSSWCSCFRRRHGLKNGGPDPEPEPQPEPAPEAPLALVPAQPGDGPHPEPEPEPESTLGTRAGLQTPATAKAENSSGLLRINSGAEPQGTVRILDASELQNAIFVSYSRRHAGALNATYVIVNALRWKVRADGSPYSRACQTGTLVPWMDKEQMAQSGGEDWARVLTEAQIRARLSVFFLSNAYCGSDECLKELQFADVEKFERIPVFLEWFVDDEEAYTKKEIAKLCDEKMKSFSGFQVASSLVKRCMTRLQGVTGPLDLSQFTCDACRAKRDTVCVRCTDWSSIQSKDCWSKINQMAEQLGTYVDAAAVKQGLLQALDGPRKFSLKSTGSSSSAGSLDSFKKGMRRIAECKAVLKLDFAAVGPEGSDEREKFKADFAQEIREALAYLLVQKLDQPGVEALDRVVEKAQTAAGVVVADEGRSALVPTLSSPTDLDLEQWFVTRLRFPKHYAAKFQSAGYQEVTDLLVAPADELTDVVEQDVGLKKPEVRKLRAELARERKKRKLVEMNAAIIKELYDRIVIRAVMQGSVVVLFAVLPARSEVEEQELDDDKLFDLTNVSTYEIVGCFDQLVERGGDADIGPAREAASTFGIRGRWKYLSRMEDLSITEWRDAPSAAEQRGGSRSTAVQSGEFVLSRSTVWCCWQRKQEQVMWNGQITVQMHQEGSPALVIHVASSDTIFDVKEKVTQHEYWAENWPEYWAEGRREQLDRSFEMRHDTCGRMRDEATLAYYGISPGDTLAWNEHIPRGIEAIGHKKWSSLTLLQQMLPDSDALLAEVANKPWVTLTETDVSLAPVEGPLPSYADTVLGWLDFEQIPRTLDEACEVIRKYTGDPDWQDPKSSPGYNALNLALAVDFRPHLQAHSTLLKQLQLCIEELPGYMGSALLYRKMELSAAEVASMKALGEFFYPSFMSTSKELLEDWPGNTIVEVDASAAGCERISLDISENIDGKGLDLYLTDFPDEAEVLFSCYTHFKVLSINESKPRRIRLKALGSAHTVFAEAQMRELYTHAKKDSWAQVFESVDGNAHKAHELVRWADGPKRQQRMDGSFYAGQSEQSGFTFLHQAAYWGNQHAVNMLIAMGASRNATAVVDRSGTEHMNPAEVARNQGKSIDWRAVAATAEGVPPSQPHGVVLQMTGERDALADFALPHSDPDLGLTEPEPELET